MSSSQHRPTPSPQHGAVDEAHGGGEHRHLDPTTGGASSRLAIFGIGVPLVGAGGRGGGHPVQTTREKSDLGWVRFWGRVTLSSRVRRVSDRVVAGSRRVDIVSPRPRRNHRNHKKKLIFLYLLRNGSYRRQVKQIIPRPRMARPPTARVFPPMEDVLHTIAQERFEPHSSTGLSLLEQIFSSADSQKLMRLHGERIFASLLATRRAAMDAPRGGTGAVHDVDIRQTDRLLQKCSYAANAIAVHRVYTARDPRHTS